MGRALYREYRPRNFKDVAGQPHIVDALERAVATGNISHAYLFTGPRGVGKTSVARILANRINGLDYNEDTNHLDIIEIDAASNRGIEDVRELRDKVAVAPTSTKYKVYIIDEVHMLTTPAFNALLKTLEEPPAHVVFILATTEAHKVPETIISRTQHFAFRPINNTDITEQLKTIAAKEKIDIDDIALNIIANHGGGSFRDCIGLLDQVRQDKKSINADDVRSLFGIAPEDAIYDIIDAISTKNPAKLYDTLSTLLEQGITASSIASQIINILRKDIELANFRLSPRQSLDIITKLIDVAPSVNPELTLEVILVGESINESKHLAKNLSENQQEKRSNAPTDTPKHFIKQEDKTVSDRHDSPKTSPQSETNSNERERIVSSNEVSIDKSEKEKSILNTQDNSSKIQNTTAPAPNFKDASDASFWPESLMIIKSSHYTLYGVLRMATVKINNSEINLGFKFKLHQKKASDPKNIEIIDNAIKKVTGSNFKINCIIDELGSDQNIPKTIDPPKPKAQVPPLSDKSLSTISNIFGGGELLES